MSHILFCYHPISTKQKMEYSEEPHSAVVSIQFPYKGGKDTLA